MAVLALFAFVATVGFAISTWSGDFLSDDVGLVVHANNLLAEHRATPALLGAFTHAEGLQTGFYRPVGLVSWVANAWLSGFDVAGWRSVNLFLHLLNGVLVWRLFARIAKTDARNPVGWLVAGAFWLYPLAPEASVWIAARFDQLALAAVLVACERHLASRRLFDTPGIFSLLALAIALASKEAAILAPGLFFLAGLMTAPTREPAEPRAVSAWRAITRSARDCVPAFVLLGLYFLLRAHLFGGAIQVYSEHPPLLAFSPAQYLHRLSAMTPVLRQPFGSVTFFLVTIVMAALAAGAFAAARDQRWVQAWLLPALATSLTIVALVLHFVGTENSGLGARMFYATGAWLVVWLFLPFADKRRARQAVLLAAIMLPVFAVFMAMAISPWRRAGIAMHQLVAAVAQQSAQLDANNEFGIILVPDHLGTAAFARNSQGAIARGGALTTHPFADRVLVVVPFADEVIDYFTKAGSVAVPAGKRVRTFCFDSHASDAPELVESTLVTPITSPAAWWREWSTAVGASACARDFPELR